MSENLLDLSTNALKELLLATTNEYNKVARENMLESSNVQALRELKNQIDELEFVYFMRELTFV